LPLFGR